MFCYQKNFSYPTLPVDEAQFNALVTASQWAENIDKYRETGDAALKRKLPAFIFQAMFDETESAKGKKGRWRKQAATRLTGLVVMDIDHLDDAYKTYEEIRTKVDFEKEGILFIYVTPSGHGLKIVFKARMEWGNLISNQHAMAKILNLTVDESCKDSSRMSFICKETDIMYLDKELFTYENKNFAERYDDLYRNGHSQATEDIYSKEYRNIGISPCGTMAQGATIPRFLDEPSGKAEHQDSLDQKSSLDNKNSLDQNESLDNNWRGYDVQAIIDQRYGANLPCREDSNRHTESLKLATDLLLMLDGDKARVQRILEAQPWVQEIIAERNENVGQTVASAADCVAQKEKKYAASLPSKAMQEAVQKVTNKSYQEITRGVAQGNVHLKDDDMARWLWDWGEQIEALSEDYPIIKDITKGLKKNQYPAALFVAGGLLMTLMTRCTYRFYHRPEELRRLNNSTLIIGDPASGKSFATRLFKILASPIVEADKVGMDAVNAYREQMRTKGANKEKPKKPKVVIRVHPARTSNAQFIQDMVNSVEEVNGEPMHLHMLTFDTELDNTLTVQKGGSWIDKMSLELKAFHNEEDGQAYSNMDSILQNFFVYWNFIYTGTPNALKKKITEQNFGSGLATRLTCIPLPSTKFKMLSRESTVDVESDNRLKEWALLLDKTKGELSVQKIVDELYDWTARRMADAEENDSQADEMLLKRCAYHGINFSAPFIVMRHWDQMKKDGEYWCGEFDTDEVDWKLAELIVNIQYACQRHYFGAMAEAYFDNKYRDASVNIRRNQKTYEAFNRLPEVFTVEDVMRCFNFSSESSARTKITRLTADSLVEKLADGKSNGGGRNNYRKTGIAML